MGRWLGTGHRRKEGSFKYRDGEVYRGGGWDIPNEVLYSALQLCGT